MLLFFCDHLCLLLLLFFIIETKVVQSFEISIRVEYYQKLFDEVSQSYDTNFTNPIQSAEEWIEKLTVCTTLNQFMRKFLRKNLQNDNMKILQNKYSRLLENEKITEQRSVSKARISKLL